MSNEEDRRKYFRVRYPNIAHPLLVLRDKALAVTELSEGGMRVLEMDPNIPKGTPVTGRLELLHGEQFEVEAQVGRWEAEECVLVYLSGITFASVMREQQHLVQEFPDFRPNKEA